MQSREEVSVVEKVKKRGGRGPVRVAVIGWGTIGSGVIKLLREGQARLSARLGHPIELARVVDIDVRRKREVKVPKSLLSKDAAQVINDPNIDVIVELMGGLEPARTFVRQAIEQGKAVVTANKALLAHHGPELFRAAESRGSGFGFEAAVGGGIPIIRTLREGLGSDRNSAVFGIVNGTANYILSTMEAEGRTFQDVLSAAQADGLAEADPTYDVEGIDAAHKLTLLIQLAFGARVPLNAVHTEGIRLVDAIDMQFARDLGYTIKLLAIGKDHGAAGIEARVHPTMIPGTDPLANVNGAFNAVCVHGDALDRSMYYGLGAGMMPTATAVVADVLDVARDRLTGRARLEPLGFPVRSLRKARVRPIGDISSEFYLRFDAKDEPGVLADIAGDLGRNGISIASVVQSERRSRGRVPVIIRTHDARERDLRRALARVSRRSRVGRSPVAIRIEQDVGA